MFGFNSSRKIRELEQLLCSQKKELNSLQSGFNALQSDITLLMEAQTQLHRYYGEVLLEFEGKKKEQPERLPT